jgi:hypothetical protein
MVILEIRKIPHEKAGSDNRLLGLSEGGAAVQRLMKITFSA